MSKLQQWFIGGLFGLAVAGVVSALPACGGATDSMRIDREVVEDVDCITVRAIGGGIQSLSCNWEAENDDTP